MKLVALWVDRYMGINQQGFNFGSSLTYDFKFDKNKRELFINAQETPEYFDFFADKSIINITGVIGINGSGKTTLLKLLNVISSKKPLIHPIVLVFEDSKNKKIKIITYSLYRKEYSLKITLPKEGSISQASQKGGNLEVVTTEIPFSGIDILFYSNLYSDHNDKYLSLKNELNRSVDYQTRISLHPERIRNYLKKYDKQIEQKNLLAQESFNILRLYKTDRLRRLFTFLHDTRTKYPEITNLINKVKFPNELTIWFNEEIYNNTDALIKRSLYNFDKLRTIYTYCYEAVQKEKRPKVKFRNEVIYKSFFYAFYNDSFKQSSKRAPLSALETFISNLNPDQNIFEVLKDLMLTEKNTSEFFEISKLNGLLRNLDADIEKININYEEDFFQRHVYALDIGDNIWPLFNRLLSIGFNDEDYIIQYSWVDLSAGEEAILNQLSEYYYAFSKLEQKNVIVTIDEGELFLHPEWQRQYINLLYKYFSFFSEKTNQDQKFQFIITSHSPFIAGDIPKYNLVFLERKDTGECKVSKAIDHKATFGGNIFELFSDSFFVKDFISDFAFSKINEAFKFLRDGKSADFSSINQVELFSKSIGEAIIREELQKLIDRKKMTNFDQYYEIVKSEEKKIDKENNKNTKDK